MNMPEWRAYSGALADPWAQHEFATGPRNPLGPVASYSLPSRPVDSVRCYGRLVADGIHGDADRVLFPMGLGSEYTHEFALLNSVHSHRRQICPRARRSRYVVGKRKRHAVRLGTRLNEIRHHDRRGVRVRRLAFLEVHDDTIHIVRDAPTANAVLGIECQCIAVVGPDFRRYHSVHGRRPIIREVGGIP